jgi:DNA-directed RNA polymerase specialized sigma24 family protein
MILSKGDCLPHRAWALIWILAATIGPRIKTVSPVTGGHAVVWLGRRAGRRQPGGDGTSRSTHDLLDLVLTEARAIQGLQRRRYDRAATRARLPEDLSGEIYIRGWRNIRRYDHRKAPLEVWLRGFIRRLRKEETRWPGPAGTIVSHEAIADVVDRCAADPAEVADEEMAAPLDGPAEEEFEDIFSALRDDFVRGFDRVVAIGEVVTLQDLRLRALRSCLDELGSKHRQVIEAVICQGHGRDEVAGAFGYEGRGGVDQAISRFQREVTALADQLRRKLS